MSFDQQLGDAWWRLNNLYKIKDKQGNLIQFKPNWAQKDLYNTTWYLNCILKARQLGMTTMIQLFMLDRCLFNDNQNAGIVAHNKEDAEAFFADKIKVAYDNLPKDLQAMRPATSDTARSLRFNNGSQIRVGTSMRSGTYQYLHISEFGKMCAKYPDKAHEVITGSLNTVAPGQFIFIESTAEGPFGEFYDMCQRSEDMTAAVNNGDNHFTEMDYKFFFYPWFKHPDYELHEKVEIPEKLMLYFQELRMEHGIDLPPEKKFWYVKKAAEQQQNMKQEYPSTAAEAFERTTELAIYGKQLRKARHDRRIGKLPIDRSLPINTFWDIGRNDVTSIWFHQYVDVRHHFLYYYESRLVDLAEYARKLIEFKEDYGWFYGRHYLPHDVEVTDLSTVNNMSRRMILEAAGVRPLVVVPRIRSIHDGIELTRKIFDSCWFDEEGCEVGLRALSGYEWTWDALYKTTRETPAKNWARNGADAFRQFAQGFRGGRAGFRAQSDVYGSAQNPREYARRGKSKRGSVFNPNVDHVL